MISCFFLPEGEQQPKNPLQQLYGPLVPLLFHLLQAYFLI